MVGERHASGYALAHRLDDEGVDDWVRVCIVEFTGEGHSVIPTMILFGLVAGRWWRFALGAAAVVWPVVLVIDGVMGVSVGLLGAALLGAANAAVGVAFHQGLLLLVRRVRTGPSEQPT